MGVRTLSQREQRLLAPVRLACSLDPGLRGRAVMRFAHPFYALQARSWMLDLLFSFGAAFAAAGILLRDMRIVRPADRVEVVLESGTPDHHAACLASIEEHLHDVRLRRAGEGEGMTQPPAGGRAVEPVAAIRAALALMVLAPYLLGVSILLQRNILRGTIRTVVVFLRARHHFRSWPCDVYLTYRDNQCSAAFYGGFHESGGTHLFAFQNGIRFPCDGLDGSCFDHLFTLGEAYAEMYVALGGLVRGSTPVGSLRIATNPHLIPGSAPLDYGILAVDQGPPDAPASHWGTLPPESTRRFIDDLKRFAASNPKIKVAYQLRCYGTAIADEVSIRNDFEGTAIELLDGCRRMASYDAVARSRLVLTMNSTLGLEALALGRPALFLNYTGKAVFDVLPGPPNLRLGTYEEFEAAVRQGLEGRPTGDSWQHYHVKNTFIGPHLIAARIRRSLQATRTR